MQRLAGAEEVKQAPDNRLIDPSINKDVENSVQACLLKVWFKHLHWNLPFFCSLDWLIDADKKLYVGIILCGWFVENKKTPYA